jgi:hypothetical protein
MSLPLKTNATYKNAPIESIANKKLNLSCQVIIRSRPLRFGLPQVNIRVCFAKICQYLTVSLEEEYERVLDSRRTILSCTVFIARTVPISGCSVGYVDR